MSESTEMKNLGNLSPAKGSHRSTKRLGRGIGSGLGKTSGKGHKGQWARKGGGVRTGFEGGQMKLYMRLPKRGFKSPFRVEYNEVNIEILNRYDNGTKIDEKLLQADGLLRHKGIPVKILGRGKLEKKVELLVHKISAGAQAAVEKAGGSVQLIPGKEQASKKKPSGKRAKRSERARVKRGIRRGSDNS